MTRQQAIVLVEDNDDDAELTTMAFAEAKVSNPIVRLVDGVDALEYFFCQGRWAGRDPADAPAVVLLDLKLPGLSGLEVLSALRADARTKHLPVVVLTSSDEDADRLAAYGHHVNSYVRKPVDYDQFVAATRQLGVYWMMLNLPPPARLG
ncbi:MAG TPA: response regulator [Polyangia bacterium]|nr:response regulator [Polyangia bacterium]